MLSAGQKTRRLLFNNPYIPVYYTILPQKGSRINQTFVLHDCIIGCFGLKARIVVCGVNFVIMFSFDDSGAGGSGDGFAAAEKTKEFVS